MIYDKIANYKRYNLTRPFNTAFEHALSLNTAAPLGSTMLDGGVKASIAEYTTKLADTVLPEAHRRFTDIQIMLAGQELIGWYPEGVLSISKPYNAEQDIEFYEQKQILPASCFLPMQQGYFAIFYPWDLHMPQICVNTPEKVKKIVYKIEFPFS